MTEPLEVHQFVPCLLPMDAVGNHTLGVHGALEHAGVHGGIWAISVHEELSGLGKPYGRYPRSGHGGPRLVLYQAASVAGSLVDFVLGLSERKTLYYHNVTPPEFFEPYEPEIARGLRQAREEVERVAAQARVAIAASAYNARELYAVGVPEVVVIPPYLTPGRATEPQPELLEELRETKRGLDLLFVGRLAPNKGHEHLIRLTSVIRSAIEPDVRLFLVGGPGPPAYMRALRRLIDQIAPGAVLLTGGVSDEALAAYYATADVFVSTSQHEGFGIPLLEAMRAGVPIVAYDAGAVGETLGGAGVLVETTDPTVLAEIVTRIARDERLRAELCQGQRARATELEGFNRDGQLIEALRRAAH
ncbi:MAG: glycosyltransferase family 4 protein [Candidatus Dormibacteraeota bacterium]|nr:glycosyltransferase family 4 protein [Candidatus Dormibacteraeota bacterium]